MLSLLGTPLVGRHDELHRARTWLRGDARVVTLWGPPGIGKTRLARVLCDEQRPSPVVVPLAEVHGAGGLIAAVSAALRADPDPTGALTALGDRWLLLDTLEHLLDADADAVVATLTGWLVAAPELTILVTSQRRLRLSAERALELGPLDAAEDGLALLIAMVRQYWPDFAPDEVERRRLVRLVRELDGIPLALELAAARWELLGTEGLLERLGRGLSLLSRPRSTDPRHATLRAAMAWAWDLLDPLDQQALRALAVFRSTFDLQAAEALVGPDALTRVETLRDAALVTVPQPGRFQLFDSLRRFVREQTPAPERAVLDERHATWCVARAPDADAGHADPALRDDLLAAAWVLLAAGDVRAEAAVAALGVAAPGQHVAVLDEAVRVLGTPSVLRTRARARRQLGRSEEARADLDAALALTRDERQRGHLLREIGVLHHGQRHVDEARSCYEEALSCARSAGDARSEALAIGNLGALDHDICLYEDAEARYTRALAGLRACGDRRTEAVFLQNQAVLRQEQGQLVAAADAYARGLELLDAEDDLRMQAIILSNIGLLQLEEGEVALARRTLQRSLGCFSRVPDPSSEARCRARLAAALARSSEVATASRQLEAAERLVAGVDPVVARVVALFGAFVDAARGHTEGVAASLAEAERGDGEEAALVAISADARVAVRLLRRTVQVAGNALRIGSAGFQLPGEEPQDLSRYATTRRMFQALVDHRREQRPRAVTLEELFEAGWPGESIAYDSMRNRVHVNLARLRRMGLKHVLLRDDDGYRLDPELPVVDDV